VEPAAGLTEPNPTTTQLNINPTDVITKAR
jgi:hypothetical protein